jgi:amino acid adenylation domain-containing protein
LSPAAAHDALPVHRLVAAHARRAPDALAVADEAASLTYGELDERAGRAAGGLLARGVRVEAPVAICLPRSIDLLVGQLAAFKAGAAAALLDPAWPRRRLDRALDALRPEVVIDGAELAALLDAGRTAAVDVPVALDNVAYLVQTSGSTGAPKSVGVLHRALAHRAWTHRDGHRIEASDRTSWLTPPGSSISSVELWPYLAAGASVHAAGASIVASPAELRDWMVAQRITKAFVTMPLAEALYGLDWPPETELVQMTVGGDSVRVWPRERLPFEVAVEYGCAEASGVTSCLAPPHARCTSATVTPAERRRRPPIGRPWPDVRADVVDEALAPLPHGELGELVVASPELARGYVGDPRATAERFVPDPRGAAGGRVYRTGDFARRRPDGLLEHRGRIDAQVKIDGHRVEPADVEAALLAHPRVAAAVVTAATDPAGNRRLAAYLVPAGAVDVDAVRSHASERLPAHMAPAAYVVLPRLPVGISGKVDRAGLPAPDWTLREDDGAAPEERGPLDRELLAVWAEVTGAAPARMDEHFFERGGDSLAAGRLVARVRDRFGVRLRLRDFVRDPTPAGVARRLRAPDVPRTSA